MKEAVIPVAGVLMVVLGFGLLCFLIGVGVRGVEREEKR
jgi:hypothetical protein